MDQQQQEALKSGDLMKAQMISPFTPMEDCTMTSLISRIFRPTRPRRAERQPVRACLDVEQLEGRVVPAVVLAPLTNDLVTATVTTASPDNAPVTLDYHWTVNGTDVKDTLGTSSLTDTLDLSAPGNGDKGDQVAVSVVPHSEGLDGDPATASAIVGNTPPVENVTLDNHAPAATDTLTATAAPTDADTTDTLTNSFEWSKNGTVVKTTPASAATTDTLTPAEAGGLVAGDVISVKAVANDGTDDSLPATDTATVGGTVGVPPPGGGGGGGCTTPPVACCTTCCCTPCVCPPQTCPPPVGNPAPVTPYVQLDNHSPKTNDTITATASVNNPDNVPYTLTYTWTVDGGAPVQVTSGTTALTDSLDLSVPGNGDVGQTVQVAVSVDGSSGTPATDQAVVAPSPPSATVDLGGAGGSGTAGIVAKADLTSGSPSATVALTATHQNVLDSVFAGMGKA